MTKKGRHTTTHCHHFYFYNNCHVLFKTIDEDIKKPVFFFNFYKSHCYSCIPKTKKFEQNHIFSGIKYKLFEQEEVIQFRSSR